MLKNIAIPQIVPLLLAATPISLLIIKQFKKILSPLNPNLAKTTIICTDLTGTLTKNVLIPQTFIIDENIIENFYKKDLLKITNTATNEEIRVEKSFLKNNDLARLSAITTTLCHYPKLKELEDILKKFFLECGFNKHKIEADYEKIQEIPSNKEKKISTVVTIKKETGEIFSFSKGNPLKILKKCSRIIINGKKVDITNPIKKRIKNKIKRLNQDGQKLIAFAYKGLPLKKLEHYTEQFAENDLIFIGIIGIANPINTELKESIFLAKRSGIKIYITTDHRERKAIAAAKKLEIINPSHFQTVTSSDLEEINDKKLEKLLQNKEKDFIFCELTKNDKLRIMETLKKLGETVAIANKKYGNGFKVIVQGIKKERISNINSRKYIYHAIECKIAEFFLILTALLLGNPSPLSISMILLIDIFINLSIELSLKKDTLIKDVMRKKFKPASTKIRIGRILLNGFTMYAILASIYFFTLMRFGWTLGRDISTNELIFEKSAVIIFVLLSIMQILNAFNIRHSKKSVFRRNIFSNYYLVLTSVITLLIIYIVTNFEYLQSKLNLSSLESIEWKIIIFSSFGIILIEEIRKHIKRQKTENVQNP